MPAPSGIQPKAEATRQAANTGALPAVRPGKNGGRILRGGVRGNRGNALGGAALSRSGVRRQMLALLEDLGLPRLLEILADPDAKRDHLLAAVGELAKHSVGKPPTRKTRQDVRRVEVILRDELTGRETVLSRGSAQPVEDAAWEDVDEGKDERSAQPSPSAQRPDLPTRVGDVEIVYGDR